MGKKNFFLSPSYRNYTTTSVTTLVSKCCLVIHEMILDFGEMRGGILTCVFWGVTKQFGAKTNRQTRKSPQKALKEQKSKIFYRLTLKTFIINYINFLHRKVISCIGNMFSEYITWWLQIFATELCSFFRLYVTCRVENYLLLYCYLRPVIAIVYYWYTM